MPQTLGMTESRPLREAGPSRGSGSSEAALPPAGGPPIDVPQGRSIPPGALPESVLIVRLGALGDVVNALALANALVRARADLRVGWACHELALPLLEGHPAIARVHVWRRGGGINGFRQLVREIRDERYGAALDLQRLTKSALLARMSGAARTLGFDRARTKEGSWLWLGEHLAPADSARPMAEQALDFARHLGLSEPRVDLDLPRRAEEDAWAEQWERAQGRPPLLLNLGATKPANRWSAASWGALARALVSRKDVAVALTGGPGDRLFAEEVRAAGAEAALDLVGATSVPRLVALQRRARLVVTCDTGPMHTAAAVGAPVLALFGAADERRTGPYGQGAHVLRTRPPCAPCGRRTCPLPRHVCMEELSVEAVLAAVARRLDPGGDAGA